MVQKSLKRSLVETNLERKCRILFGVCLLVFVSLAFYWVDRVTRRLIVNATRQQAGNQVVTILHRKHLVGFETDLNPEMKEMADELSHDFQGDQKFKWEIISLQPQFKRHYLNHVQAPGDPEEQALLEELANKISAGESEGEGDDTAFNPRQVNVARIDKESRQYQYYEAIHWGASCTDCHAPVDAAASLPAGDVAAMTASQPPMQVIKVIMPYKETEAAISQANAILITVALATVFVSMLGLYLIVKVVIVKPLKHLRDVSDEISRGNSQLRAEIETNDEFQELAGSFNRMLHHLMDAQGELEQVNVELDARVDQLAQLNMRLYEMNRMKDDFLANMSHELRTPLNSIIGFSDVLQNIDSLDEKQKRYAGNIQKSGRLLLEMITDILDLAKMEAGKMELRPTEFLLHSVVHAQCDMVRSLTEEKQIDLAVDVPRELPPVFQDQKKLQQVLTNLLSNAIKFTPEGGRIIVKAHQTADEMLEMTVEDTGVGIPAEDREVIFEKFRQSSILVGDDGLTREYSGTGLGLSIIKELCKLMGGRVSFESEVGKGSTFKVTVPWNANAESQFNVALNARLREMSKPTRADFQSSPSDPPVSTSADS
ncbi:MAG: two-component sensor histidine kinase [Blastopirellula sp.]|nr:two-component sensor histidine kinase [Blastopirellula sp.]